MDWKTLRSALGAVLTARKDLYENTTALGCSFSVSSWMRNFSNFQFEFNGALYFQGYDAINGVELWKYDGVGAPALFVDLNPGAGNGLQTEGFGPFQDAAVTPSYFVIPAVTTSAGFEPVRSDGTVSGTFLLKDIYAGASSSITGTAVYSIASLGSKVVFVANDNVHGKEFWVTDGSTSGTQILKLIDQSYAPSSLSSFKILDGKFYFTADDGVHGRSVSSFRSVTMIAGAKV